MNFIRTSPTAALSLPATPLTLANKLTLIHQHIPGCGVTTVDVWVKAGAIREINDWSGMAHFLEHMIFKGTARILPGQFDSAIEGRGGMTNAATSYDYAHYFMTLAAPDLVETLPYLADLLLQAAIPDEEFVREREVVFEEIYQTYDSPDYLAFQALVEGVYQRHPYGRPILGTEDLLKQRSPEEMRSFHRRYYQPENMTVVLVGDIAQDQAVDLVERSFCDFQPPGNCPQHQFEAEPPMTRIRRQELRLPRLEQARLMMAWIGPGTDAPAQEKVDDGLPWNRFRSPQLYPDPIKDACGLDLLSATLAEGRTSRLVQELREERQLVSEISSGFSLQQESSLFTITAWLEAEDLERVEALICDRFSHLITAAIDESELNRSKRLLCNDHAFSTETPSQIAGLYGYYHTLADLETAIAYPQWIQAFTSEELQAIANRYLSPYRYAAIVTKPL
ncbi:M16 family metallopeptidase [Myxacorys almedinensis]|uniref:Insulinase family protein n=1 Tax=Myxacorys almedinensis A TaxID=2690445 RepID=A0A8J7Z3W1_9CYAN|nr:pitrilysin family protein [Myxacorys almedinensis]NDJ19947.1 insulinase family protein [Myxacorys almedinensis A]